jgi:hypothetical protein
LIQAWGLSLEDREDEGTLIANFAKCVAKSLRQKEFDKMDEEEQDYLAGTLASTNEIDVRKAKGLGKDDETDQPSPKAQKKNPGREEYNSLTASKDRDRTFAAKGASIDVFKIDGDDLELTTTISSVEDPKGSSISPSKMMLHEQESSMIFLTPTKKNSAYKMDLTTSKVVQEWDLLDSFEMLDITGVQKDSSTTITKEFLGITHNAILRIDPREKGPELIPKAQNQFSGKKGFTCVATTDKGELTIGSEKGEIRLYDDPMKKAKTELPGLGDPIIGIDVSHDGEWVLATCKRYILIIPTKPRDSDVSLWKSTSAGKKKVKPQPIRLIVKPEDVAKMGLKEIAFTPAHFRYTTESHICTSCGNWAITWNFRRIKLGDVYSYRYHNYEAKVIASDWAGNSIVLALPKELVLASSIK